jgi:molybdenum cofactor cytidylyltransferase
MTEVVILIPAAGAARRMGGRDKLTEPVGDVPALARAVRMALATGARVIVTLPASGPYLAGRCAALEGTGAEALTVPDAAEGMAASLRAGAAAAGDAAGLMVLLPDMPEIETADLARLIAAFAADPDRPLRAAAGNGTPGHPVILPRRLLPALGRLTGDRGARTVLEGEQVGIVPLPDRRAILDLDTPEDWTAWRRGR